jgi:replicative DNA helicase
MENTFTGYLGQDYQQKLMWQLLVEPEFAEKTVPLIAIEYFDDVQLKKLFIIILEFIKKYEKVPNLQNKSIHQAIHEFNTQKNEIEEQSLLSIINRITLYNDNIINNNLLYDGDIVRKTANEFITQQEYRKVGEFIIEKTKRGELKNKNVIPEIEEKFIKISQIGNDDDFGINVFDDIDVVLRKEFRTTIPTGIDVIDSLTNGGLGGSEIGLILCPSGVGKSLPLSAKLATPNGWILMGDVKINDLVIGSDGKQQRVLGVYPQGKRPIYKIVFNDKTTAFCDEEHLWAVNTLNQRNANTTRHINGEVKRVKTPDLSYNPIATKELMKNYIVNNKSGEKLNYRIPILSYPVEYTINKLPINPYLLGALIGDGGLTSGTTKITSIDDEIINKLRAIISNEYSDLKLNRVSNTVTYIICGIRGKKNCLYQAIKDLKLNVSSNSKHIPDIYKYSSSTDRIELLQGLLDTDGYASKSGRIQYATTSKQLADDVREVVLSLGGFVSIREKFPKYKYINELRNGKKAYTLTISFSNLEIKPFSLGRKQERVVYRSKYRHNKYISLITYSHEEEAQCIYVENDDHLYVTDDYILTHNTTLLTKIANTAYGLGNNVAQVIFEDTKEQIQRKHFTIWSDVPLSQIDESEEKRNLVKEIAQKKALELNGKGRLIIKRFSQEDTTMKDIRNWMVRTEKKFGYKFDILVLDYLDCVEPYKKVTDRNEAELQIIKSFEALSSDFNIPAWTAIQSNRQGIDQEIVGAHHSGGSIKRLQKSHFFMSVAKTPDQKEANLANINIIKARFASDGQIFKDCEFNNDSMRIVIHNDKYKNIKLNSCLKHYDEDDVKNVINHAELLNKYSDIDIHDRITEVIKNPSDFINNSLVGDLPNEDENIVVETNKNIIKSNINSVDVENLLIDPETLDNGCDINNILCE